MAKPVSGSADHEHALNAGSIETAAPLERATITTTRKKAAGTIVEMRQV
jgi:hypothetical protein